MTSYAARSSSASGKVVRFCLSAVDGPAAKKGKDRRLQDETPDRASDDSSDVESVVDDEDLGEEGDDGMSSEEEDSIAPLPKKKKKKKTKSKKREESSSEEEDEDDTSTLSRSVVSGTSRRSGAPAPAPPQKEDEEVPKGLVGRRGLHPQNRMRKDEDGWRKAAPSSGSMLASLLGAPLHRADGFQAQGHPVAQAPTSVTTAVGGSKPQGDSLSRELSSSCLARHGYPTVQLDDSRALQPGNPEMVKYDLELEASDPLALHEITVQFAAFRANTLSQVLPRAVYFTFQFYTLPPTRTERFRFASRAPEESKVDRGVEAPNDASPLTCEGDRISQRLGRASPHPQVRGGLQHWSAERSAVFRGVPRDESLTR